MLVLLKVLQKINIIEKETKMTDKELYAGLDLLHDPEGTNIVCTTPTLNDDDIGDDASVTFYHKGLTYTFYELVDIVIFVNEGK